MLPPTDSPESPAPDDGRPSRVDDARWVAALYGELRSLAQSELAAERPGHTLSATALVNEVYLKFAKQAETDGRARIGDGPGVDRGVFFGLAAQAMRRILVDHARGRQRQKRGGGKLNQDIDGLLGVADSKDGAGMDPVELDEALTKLAVEHEQAARVVELRFFAGLPETTIAEVLSINERTVRRHWTFAKAWLTREMDQDGERPAGSE